MTELAIPTQNTDGLGVWADSFIATARVSSQLARTAFVPASLRAFRNNGRDYDADTTAAQITAAILTGRELGMEPMAALRSIHVIQGTPALSALALRALLLSHGHDIVLEEATNTRATIAGRRKGADAWQRITWTMDDAKARNLAGKPNWRSQPRNMLIARATADVARLVAADVLLGVPYVIEELEDADGQPPILVAGNGAGPGPAKRTAQRRGAKPAPAIVDAPPAQAPTVVEDEPAFDDDTDTFQPEPDPDPGPEPDPDDPITDPQMRKMQAAYRQLHVDGRDERLADASGFIGRDLASAKELTKNEASALISDLDRRLMNAEPEDGES